MVYGTGNLSFAWMDVHFLPNVRGCVEAGSTFQGWEVEQKAGTGSFVGAAGSCGDLATSSTRSNVTVSCTATGLVEYTNYVFRVREVCTDATRHGAWVDGTTRRTWRESADAPGQPAINETTITRDSMQIDWT